jgi:hypothetical protein
MKFLVMYFAAVTGPDRVRMMEEETVENDLEQPVT